MSDQRSIFNDPTRASLLGEQAMAIYDDTHLIGEFCHDCGLFFWTRGDVYRHMVVVNDTDVCPRNLLAVPGRQRGDRYRVLVYGHTLIRFVHGLNPDGSPRSWQGNDEHTADCAGCAANRERRAA